MEVLWRFMAGAYLGLPRKALYKVAMEVVLGLVTQTPGSEMAL